MHRWPDTSFRASLVPRPGEQIGESELMGSEGLRGMKREKEMLLVCFYDSQSRTKGLHSEVMVRFPPGCRLQLITSL